MQRILDAVRRALTRAAGLLWVVPCAVLGAAPADLTRLSLEELMEVEVQTASRYRQNTLDAPSAVSVISAEDIRNFGWRSLADILRSVRSFYLSYDRNYSYIGVRGFGRPGDYNSRLVLLVDGYRINDNVYDTAYVGTEFPVDVDLIERVEVVRGPGSAMYGGNALFGVVNVITRQAGAGPAAEATASAGSEDSYAARATLSKSFDSGLRLLVSGTWRDSDGPDNFFPEFADPATNNGFATGADYDRGTQVFAKASYGKFALDAAWAQRNKGLATGVFGTVFNDPRSRYLDEQTYLNLAWYDTLAGGLETFARVYYGRYRFTGDYIYDYPPLALNRDEAVGEWWGIEARGSRGFGPHKVVFGADYQDNLHQDQRNFDLVAGTACVAVPQAGPCLDQRASSRRLGLYAQDEWAFAERWSLNAGLRYDDLSDADSDWNLRLGLIYRPQAETALKLIYGTASRPANAYERDYSFPGASPFLANPGLGLERIKALEGIWEQGLGHNLKFTAIAYRYQMHGLINQQDVGGALQFQNLPTVTAHGLELELEGRWQDGLTARGSVATQSSHAPDGLDLTNSPTTVAKLNILVPLIPRRLNAGFETQYIGSRRTDLGTIPGYGVSNVNLRWFDERAGYELALAVYNAFNERFYDPSGPDPALPNRDRLEQDGATWRLKFTTRF
jgi:iron complex outermembrane receptor protein